MERPRIRWRNVGRLAAGLGTGGLLIGILPGALEPPEPPPLPRDVGLTGIQAAKPRPQARRSGDRSNQDAPVRPQPGRQQRREGGHERVERKHGGRPSGGEVKSPPPAVPTGVPASAPMPPAPAPPPAPVAAPATPEPAPPPDQSAASAMPDSPPPGPPPSPGPAPFGFEH